LAVVALSLFFFGCFDSKNPLSDPQKAKLDARLTGLWQVREKHIKGEDATYCHIGVAGDELPAGVMRVVVVRHDKDGRITRPAEFLMFSTTIGTNTYLNLALVDDEHLKVVKEKGWTGIEGYVLWKYKVEADTILLWKMAPDAKQRAIEGRKVKGVIKEGVLMDMNTITDTTENLARFVASAGDSLFSSEAVHLERVK
jgi:hypothetical protein